MNAPERLRRGACPGLSAPMQTGDGLLARLTPVGLIALDAFAGLCAAAGAHGNGIVEVTSRGSIQVRGLRAATAPLFAVEVAALRIEASDGIPVLTDPLSGDHALAAEIRSALAAASLAARLSAKVSVTVDLDLAADIAVRSLDDGAIHLVLASSPLGAVPRKDAAFCVQRLLETLAAMAPGSRMRDVLERGGIEAFQSAIADCLVDRPPPARRFAAEPIGIHNLSSDAALGIGLPFGHSDAATLIRLADAARQAGAAGVRTAPGRVLLVMGLSPAAAATVTVAAEVFGFIVDPADPRRRIVACAGAPICASGEIPARALAPFLRRAAENLADGEVIHLSGCIKGCAHPAPAPVAVIGRAGQCDIVVEGRPSGSVTPDALPQRLADVLRDRGGSP
jgi:precorrin-3B synthase